MLLTRVDAWVSRLIELVTATGSLRRRAKRRLLKAAKTLSGAGVPSALLESKISYAVLEALKEPPAGSSTRIVASAVRSRLTPVRVAGSTGAFGSSGSAGGGVRLSW